MLGLMVHLELHTIVGTVRAKCVISTGPHTDLASAVFKVECICTIHAGHLHLHNAKLRRQQDLRVFAWPLVHIGAGVFQRASSLCCVAADKVAAVLCYVNTDSGAHVIFPRLTT